MKPKKPERSVSSMDVLKDIRELLSTTQKREDSAEALPRGESGQESKTVQLEEELRRYKELVQKQQEELRRLESEKKELAARLSVLSSSKDELASPVPGAKELKEEVARLEARRDELSSAVSEIESLLQLKVKDLINKIARIFQEAGQDEITLDIRRVRDELEVYDNFAYFVRELLR